MTFRRIHSIRPAQRHDIGNFYTRLVFSTEAAERLDPFLLLTHHGPQLFPANSAKPPFGAHPHRGFETVTFILDGALVHLDSAGHGSLIHAGGVQWMTAGAGVIHDEAAPESFWKDGGRLEIVQLWINLPSRLKMTTPRYAGFEASDIPSLPIGDGGGRLALISGEFGGSTGPVESLTDIFMSSLALPSGASVTLPAPDRNTVLFYIVSGEVMVDGRRLAASHLAIMNEEGDTLEIAALSDARVIFGHGPAIREPIVVGGPFVMNSAAEIERAYVDYRSGKFDAGS